MIRQETARHNLTLTAATLLLGLVLAAGCGSDPDPAHESAPDKATAAAACGLTVDTSAWETFHRLAVDLTAGKPVTREELDVYANLEPVALWRGSMEFPPMVTRVSNWLEAAFAPPDNTGKPVKRNPDRRVFSQSYRYSFDHTADIDAKLDLYRSETHRCQLMDQFRRWLSPRHLDGGLVLNFLPAKPEIRAEKHQLFVDTGVLAASRTTQLDRQLTALLYRTLEAIPGRNPLAAEGREAVAHAMRVMVNEGTAIYIEDLPDTYFDRDHPTLGDVSVVAEDMFRIGLRTIDNLNGLLPQLFADPAVMNEMGLTLAESMAAGGSFQQCGYAMCLTIAGHLGEDRLREVRLSPPAFLAAYQEAALRNGTHPAAVGRLGTELHENMKPLDPPVFDDLHALLLEYFPAS